MDNMTDGSIEAIAESLLMPNQPEAEVDADEVTETPESEEVETEEVEAQEDDDAEEQAETAPEEDDEADEDGDADEAPGTYTVKVDGVEQEVTLDQLKRSYSGDAYIQQGMQEAAAKRKEAETFYSQLQAQQQQLVQVAQSLNAQGILPKPTPPGAALAQTDPVGYMQEKAAYDAQLDAYNGQQAQIRAVEEQHRQTQTVAQQRYVEEQRQRLQQAIPDFADPVKGPALQQSLVRFGTERYGLPEEALAGVTDATHVQILHDAMQYHALKSGAESAKAVAKVKPAKSVKPRAKAQGAGAARRKKIQDGIRRGDEDAILDFLVKPD